MWCMGVCVCVRARVCVCGWVCVSTQRYLHIPMSSIVGIFVGGELVCDRDDPYCSVNKGTCHVWIICHICQHHDNVCVCVCVWGVLRVSICFGTLSRLTCD